MADEEKNDPLEETPSEETPAEETPAAETPAEESPAEETPAEQPPAEEAPAEEAAAEEPAAEEAAAEETPAEEASTEEAAADAPAGAERGEKPSPRARRKQARATKKRRPGPSLSPEDRAKARLELRKKKAAVRRDYRARQRATKAERGPREGTPPVVKEPGTKRVRQGVVVSNKADKTITVNIQKQESHRMYGKVVRSTIRLHAHDEQNEANPGDTVRVIESRPLSRTKRWRLVEVVERAR